jgi:hypothetical protein
VPGVAYVHIGLGKTGTSSIQRSLSENQAALAQLGIEVPGSGHGDARRAVYDLMGRRIGGADRADNARVAGTWAPYAAAIAASTAPSVVFSEEMLALARPPAIRRLVASLAPRRVVVIVTIRDLGRTLGSFWQQMLMMGRTETLADFVAAVRDPSSGPASASVGFRLRQDLVRVLAAWESAVPAADMRIVTVPSPGQRPDLLNDRFASVIGAPDGLLRSSEGKSNASVGVIEAEVVRRLNVELGSSINEQQRLQLMRTVRLGLVERSSAPISPPPAEAEWIRSRAASMVSSLQARGYELVGTWDDLAPVLGAHACPPSETDLAAATLTALGAVSRSQSALFSQNRRLRRRLRGVPEDASAADLASRRRAAGFRLKARLLEKSDSNRLLGWAARTYLKRTSGRS